MLFRIDKMERALEICRKPGDLFTGVKNYKKQEQMNIEAKICFFLILSKARLK